MMLTYDAIQAFLYQEERAQAEKRWADWLACYADDVDYFMPSWDDDDTLTTDPHNEVSLIYYPSKQGLEDRVFRIKTERSSATMPDTRTSLSARVPGRSFGIANSETPLMPAGAPSMRASVMCTMFSVRSWSAPEMKILLPDTR